MGNINSLSRDGFGMNNYTGYYGKRLTSVSGFTNSNYSYDINGNLTNDSQKNIILGYNYLNLPQTVSGSQNITYTYNALGEKLKKQSGGVTTDYVRGIQYTNGNIDFIHTEEGLARNSNGNYSYEYNLSDHLGNVRTTFYKNPNTSLLEVLQRDDYYSFGLSKPVVAGANNNKYLYNGKELQEELGQYDYGARFYDPVIGRWNSVDPHGEKYESISNYSYVFNNPVRFIDLQGKDPGDVVVVFGGADLFGTGDKGGASLITQRLQQQYLNKNGGRAEAFFSRYWGTSLDGTKGLDQATQGAYDYILDNYNKDGGKEVEDGQIIIEGYSYGGVLANHLAKRLRDRGTFKKQREQHWQTEWDKGRWEFNSDGTRKK